LPGLADEVDLVGPRPAFAIHAQFVGQQIAFFRPAPARAEGSGVDEDAASAAVGRDEAKTLGVVPLGEPALKTHDGIEPDEILADGVRILSQRTI
jgi:hypothetical protein